MRRVKEVLRLAHELGYSLRQIAESVRLGRTSVLARADAAGMRYEDVADRRTEIIHRNPIPRIASKRLIQLTLQASSLSDLTAASAMRWAYGE